MYNFYLYYVIAVMFLLPITSAFFTMFFNKQKNKNEIIEIFGKWFIFWGVGIRSFTAGLNQSFNPGFTASILQIPETAFVAIKEIGFANISMGATAIVSIFFPAWRKAAGFCGGLYLGIAGFLHVCRIPEGINVKETIAMVSDLFIFAIVVVYLIASILQEQKLKFQDHRNP